MGLFSFFSKGNKLDDFLKREALLIDVRSENEFNSGSIPGAINIPVNKIASQVDKIKKYNKPVIAYCASGIRSAMATKTLKANGIEAINGGGISKMYKKISQ